MQKQEFLELFKAATEAAKSARAKNSPEVSRCVDAMHRLKEAPESLACDVVYTTTIGKSYRLFIDHVNPKIRSEAQILWDLWLSYLYATGKKRSQRSDPVKERVESSTMKKKTGDCKRDKVREILQRSLAKVASEVVETEMKKRVVACDPSSVAVSVETAMFERLGRFDGTQKLKYRSILFNLGDSKNPDLRRKVLLGEIDGERLVTMDREEMASDKIQLEVQLIKEKARFREENRIKMMLQSDTSMIIT